MGGLVKVSFSVSTTQINDGNTCVLTEEIADQIIERLENQDKVMHFEVFKFLYKIGYLEARVDKIY